MLFSKDLVELLALLVLRFIFEEPLHKNALHFKSPFVKTNKSPKQPLAFFGVVPFKRREANRVRYLLGYSFNSVVIKAGVVEQLVI
jgi:hypothetical protein